MNRSHLAREIVEIVALTLLIFIVVRFILQTYHVDGDSMRPGLTTQEFVMVNKTAYLFQSPERGDVIVFHYPHDTTQDYIKRIIGLPGDVIQMDSTHVWVNGKLLHEQVYISSSYNRIGNSWKVPPNEYFVMGDNRPVSEDSRSWGYVPKSYIVGKAALVFWPLNNLHFINTYSNVYTGLNK